MSFELDTGTDLINAFYRLVGTDAADPALVANGEGVNDVANMFLGRGARMAQQYMLKEGYDGWRARSAALVFTGTDDADGGRHADLPTDFIKAYGNGRTTTESALTQPNGTPWGVEIHPSMAGATQGNAYYFKAAGDGVVVAVQQLWVTRLATVPDPLHLHYHYRLISVSSATVAIDFPFDARGLIPAYAADLAKTEGWLPDDEQFSKISVAVTAAEKEARSLAKQSRRQRQMRGPVRFASHW